MKVSTRPSRIAAIGALGLAAAAGHIVYPAWLLFGPARKRPMPSPPPSDQDWQPLSVIVPAFREAGVIAGKVKELLDNGYRGGLEVIVVADGDPATADAARLAGARVIAPSERLGKPAAMNLGVASAETEICVFTDANNALSDGALEALVAWFADPEVGAAAGEKMEVGSTGESLYWRFESWLKTRESRLGTTIGVVGELVAVRRSAWKPIAEEVAADDQWLALDMVERGWRIAYEPSARSYEPPSPNLAANWERRTRMAAGAIHVIWTRRRQLVKRNNPATPQIWGHRWARYMIGPTSHLVLLVWSICRVRTSIMARLFSLGHLAAGGILLAEDRHLPMPRVLVSLSHVVYLQAVGIGGMIRYARDDRYSKWPTVER